MPTQAEVRSVDRFISPRHYQVWHYDVSHSQLLLRAVKTEHEAVRCDVLFKDVKTMDLPTSFDGLQIVRDGSQYALSGSDWMGRVVAGACFAAEDAGEFHDASPFSESLRGRI